VQQGVAILNDGLATLVSLFRNDNFYGVSHTGVGDYFSERKNDL
jgi:hypothetical protein